MNAFEFADSRWWSIAGWTMLHLVWVGLLIGAIGLALRRLIRTRNADVRYAVALGCFALLAISPIPVGWWVWDSQSSVLAETVITDASADSDKAVESRSTDLGQIAFENSGIPADVTKTSHASIDGKTRSSNPPQAISSQTAATLSLPPLSSSPTFQSPRRNFVSPLVNALPWLWLIGTPATFLLLATGLLGAERLRRQSSRIDDDELLAMLARLTSALRIHVKVAVGVCDRIAGPILVGIIRPMILLPATALSHWSPEQLEMVLLHELSHVRRWDNLVNLVQRVVESILFFVPTVWLVSRWVRQEREHCCDRNVVAATGKPREYAQTLVYLSDRRRSANTPRRAALTGLFTSPMAEHQLVTRVRQILKSEDEPMKISRTLFGSVVLLFAMGVAGVGWYGTSSVTAQDEAAPPESKAEDKKPESDSENNKKADAELKPVNATELKLEATPTAHPKLEEKAGSEARFAKGEKEKMREMRERRQKEDSPPAGKAPKATKRLAGAARKMTQIENIFTVRFIDDVTVSSDRPAAIESIKVHAGDVVKQGDVLATFSREGAEQSELDLKIAQTKLQSAQQDFDRAKILREKNAIQSTEFDKQRLVFELAELEFKKQRLTLDQLGKPITSPAAGVVAEVFKKSGEFVAAATPIARIVNTDKFAVEGRINIHNSSIPQRDQEFRFTLQPYGKNGEAEQRVFEGTIDYVSTEIIPADASLSVRGTIKNQDGILHAGMVGTFELVSDEAEAAAMAEPVDHKQAGMELPGKLFGIELGTVLTNLDTDLAGTRYEGGVKIRRVDPQSAAAAVGIREGDVLVGLVKWKTATYEDIGWILHQPETSPSAPLKFYILRNRETLFGSLVFNRDYLEKDGWKLYLEKRQFQEDKKRSE